jgi:hypothetical protein
MLNSKESPKFIEFDGVRYTVLQERTVSSFPMTSRIDKENLAVLMIRDMIQNGIEPSAATETQTHEMEHALADVWGQGQYVMHFYRLKDQRGKETYKIKPKYRIIGQRTFWQYLKINAAPKRPSPEDRLVISIINAYLRKNPGRAHDTLTQEEFDQIVNQTLPAKNSGWG